MTGKAMPTWMAGRRDGTLKMERKDIGAAITCPGRLRSLNLDQGTWTMFQIQDPGYLLFSRAGRHKPASCQPAKAGKNLCTAGKLPTGKSPAIRRAEEFAEMPASSRTGPSPRTARR
jgi:hypothetical protein